VLFIAVKNEGEEEEIREGERRVAPQIIN